jgi:hypothetical protein
MSSSRRDILASVKVKMKTLFMSMTVVMVLVLGKLCFADVAPPPPTSCPEGSVGATGHCMPYCEALTCQTDGDCKGGAVCREIAACVGSVICGGKFGPGVDAMAYARPTIEDTCLADATCAKGKPCQQIRLCLPAGSGGSGGTTGTTGAGGTAGTTGAGGATVTGGSSATTGTADAGGAAGTAGASGTSRLARRGCCSVIAQGSDASALFLAAFGLLAVLASPAERRATRRLWR